jgi:CrcB protein
MTPLVVIVALVAGAIGALLRFAASTGFSRQRGRLPWAVLLVNAVGSFVGGVVIGLVQSGTIGADAQLVVLSGFAGGLTTFSTFSVETVQLALGGRWRAAVASVVLNLVIGLALVTAGYALAGGFR